MKLRRIGVMVAAGMVATAITGALGVGTASASPTADSLCIINSSHSADVCAISNGSNAIKMLSPQGSTTNWNIVAVAEAPNTQDLFEIEQENTTSCMQVNHNGGNIVIMASCGSQTYQLWFETAVSINGGIQLQFKSYWDTAECLTYNANGADLKVGGCGNDWYQAFVGD